MNESSVRMFLSAAVEKAKEQAGGKVKLSSRVMAELRGAVGAAAAVARDSTLGVPLARLVAYSEFEVEDVVALLNTVPVGGAAADGAGKRAEGSVSVGAGGAANGGAIDEASRVLATAVAPRGTAGAGALGAREIADTVAV